MAVVDASVAVDWVAPGTEPDAPAQRLLEQLGEQDERLLAPRLFLEEVSNALLTGIRRRRWTGAEADASFQLLAKLPVLLVDTPADLARAWDLSRRYDQHPVYDMIYVATAERVQHRFLTADSALANRLRHLAFVELVTPG
jgi:predicted nucleic acid-binding protein